MPQAKSSESYLNCNVGTFTFPHNDHHDLQAGGGQLYADGSRQNTGDSQLYAGGNQKTKIGAQRMLLFTVPLSGYFATVHLSTSSAVYATQPVNVDLHLEILHAEVSLSGFSSRTVYPDDG